MEAIIIVIILWITSLFDSMRDGWKESNIGYYRWHAIKWAAFFTPLLYLVHRLYVLGLHWILLLLVALISWIFWQYGYHKICERPGTSIWTRWIEKIFNK